MNMEVQQSVLLALSEYSRPSSIDPQEIGESRLADIVNDSLSLLEVIYDLEDKYSITIQHEKLTSLETVDDLVIAVDGELSSAARNA
jgi:acyl carrier protein